MSIRTKVVAAATAAALGAGLIASLAPGASIASSHREAPLTSAEPQIDQTDLYGLGAAVADYDNDGRDDVFMTSVDGGRLFRNQGGGRFADVTRSAGIVNRDFAVSAAWLDYNRDGLADLFIGNYVDWSPEARAAIAAPTPTSRVPRSSIATAAADDSTTLPRPQA